MPSDAAEVEQMNPKLRTGEACNPIAAPVIHGYGQTARLSLT